MRKTKEKLIHELDELQKSFVDQRESLGQIVARQQETINELNQHSNNLESYVQIYEKTILVLTGRLLDATKGFNTLSNKQRLQQEAEGQ